MIQTVKKKPPRLSPAETAGIGAVFLALLLLPFDARIAVVPLVLFFLLCMVAPFLPGFGFFLPVISRGRTDRPVVALTFDDGPNPNSTPFLLDLLDRHQAAATFFVNGRTARRHPDLIREIVARGHTIGNHSYSHDNFVMFKRPRTLIREIEATQRVLRRHGVVPLLFRPPVGVTSPRLCNAMEATGMVVVNFSRRAADMGNRRVHRLAERILKRLRPGDIIMLHDIPPATEALCEEWRRQVEAVMAGIRQRGLVVVPLEQLIDRPVMKIV
ncbi:polysaccharide deacetylase family protein [Desulfatitalea tepidiphila]|uniref:polysaccharide deacetylase family protein n=1 Tax=Desulfatitalea tepidiphila TaxID=1185843 RepID=UPI0006B5BF40|nr:polysaccharide deacetylase family protein [Desulfatitalea tepidiphila]